MINDIYLLVGGEATRLRPLSEGIPKALLTIKGKPLIDIILSNLSDTNIQNINLICSIKHESQWNEYQKNSKFNIKLHFEKEKLDTAGYIVQNIDDFEDRFICMNGDLLINMDFSLFLNEVNKAKNSTICSIPVDDPSRYGVLELDGAKIINFIEKPEDLEYGNNISLGVYCLFKEDIQKVKNELEIPCSFEKALFPELASSQLLDCYKVEGEMIDVGTRESYIFAHTENNSNWIAHDVIIGENTKIENSVILSGSFIGDNVGISNSIICSNSNIESNQEINEEIYKKQ